MPSCTACGRQDLRRSDFSTAQLRKSPDKRKCKGCTNRSVESGSTTIREEGDPTTFANSELVQAVLNKLVEVVKERGISAQFGLDTDEKLRSRLREVLFPREDEGQLLAWLLKPLCQGLLQGGDAICVRVTVPFAHPAEPQTLLHWVCQYKLLATQLGYKGQDEMVALVVRAGAPVNATLGNGCTPIFFAVKYSSVHTVRLLIEAGANLQTKDKWSGCTCLKNAIEWPAPDILETLFENGSDPNERTRMDIEGGGSSFMITMVEKLITQFVTMSRDGSTGELSEYPTSWRILGLPPLEDYCTSIMRFLQRGAQPFTTEFSMVFFGFYIHGKPPRGETELSSELKPYCKKIAYMMLGTWLPQQLRRELKEASVMDPPRECGICLSVMGDSDEPITLYCGHAFCRECITQYGALTPLRNALVCPTCRRPLCRDVMSDENRQFYERGGRRLLGVDEADSPEHTTRGPSALTEEQLRTELIARGLSADSDPSVLQVNRNSMRNAGNIEMEFSSSRHIGTSEKITMAPKLGIVLIPITVKGICVLAFISGSCPYTIVSENFVNMFDLKKTNLRSRDFVCEFGEGNLTGTVIEEFPLSIGDINITMNNAVEIAPFDFAGVILGCDFFGSAAWTQIVVETDVSLEAVGETGSTNRSTFFVNDGLERSDLSMLNEGAPQKEELRYYAFGGKIFRTPLYHIHLGPSDNAFYLGVGITQDTRLTECEWCCRMFPTGMKKCEVCDSESSKTTYYCDEKCEEAAAAIHSRRH